MIIIGVDWFQAREPKQNRANKIRKNELLELEKKILFDDHDILADVIFFVFVFFF